MREITMFYLSSKMRGDSPIIKLEVHPQNLNWAKINVGGISGFCEVNKTKKISKKIVKVTILNKNWVIPVEK